jgi:hypothetical protein
MIFKINIFILKNQKRITITRETYDLYYGLVQYMYFFMLFMGSQKFSLHNVNIAVEDEGSRCYGKISCTIWGCLPPREYFQICKYREKTLLSLFGCFRVEVFVMYFILKNY